VTAVNERFLNLELFANVEDSVLDLYSAARNGYLQRRQQAISLAAQDRHEEWAWARTPVGEPAPEIALSAGRHDPT